MNKKTSWIAIPSGPESRDGKKCRMSKGIDAASPASANFGRAYRAPLECNYILIRTKCATPVRFFGLSILRSEQRAKSHFGRNILSAHTVCIPNSRINLWRSAPWSQLSRPLIPSRTQILFVISRWQGLLPVKHHTDTSDAFCALFDVPPIIFLSSQHHRLFFATFFFHKLTSDGIINWFSFPLMVVFFCTVCFLNREIIIHS